MSNPVPKQKKSNENITLQIQEGTGVCFPNPPQTPPIHRSSFALDNVRNQFCPAISPPFYDPPQCFRSNPSWRPWLHDPSRSKIKIPFIRKDSPLQTIFAPPGDFRREKPRRHSGEGIPRGPGVKRTAPAGAEKVIEFCMKKVVS
jgi:hypothetical protein